MRNRIASILSAVLITAGVSAALTVNLPGASPGIWVTTQAQEAPPSVMTDKFDYAPGTTVHITGSGWTGDQTVTLSFSETCTNPGVPCTIDTHPDLFAAVNPDGTFSNSEFVPDEDDIDVTFTLTATGVPSGRRAQTIFTDAAGVKVYDQCSNDQGNGYSTGDAGCRWTNGNLQSNNSQYSEGDATVQRVSIEGLAPGSTHTISLKYGTTKGGSTRMTS